MDEEDVDTHAVKHEQAQSPFLAQRTLLLIAGGFGAVALVLTVIADVTWHSQPTVVQLPERLQQLPTLPSRPALPTLPTGLPSEFPTDLPSGFPTDLPTDFPTDLPTGFPELPSLPDLPDLPGDS